MIGENLRKIRGFKGFTVARLSAESGISEYSIRKIEKGRVDPKFSTLGKLANVLGIDVQTLTAQEINLSQGKEAASA